MVGRKKSDLGADKLTHLKLGRPRFENLTQLKATGLLCWRFFWGFLLMALCAPVQLIFLLISRRLAIWFPRFFHGLLLKIFGVDLEIEGQVSAQKPTLFVANHSSYLDIPILGSVLQASFISKAEVAGWPLIGWLARMQRSLMIDRNPRHADRHKQAMEARLQAGDSLILFPEGTTSNGLRVLPFKSALFAVAQSQIVGHDLQIQAISISYKSLDGMPMGRSLRNLFAWYGDQNLASHAREALQLGRLTVKLTFHQPFSTTDFDKRRHMADHSFWQIQKGHSQALSNRA